MPFDGTYWRIVMKLSLCIPMYNESSIVCATVDTVYAAMEKLSGDTGYKYEVLFSNDGSTDNCAALASLEIEKLGASDRMRVTGYEKNRGKGAAVRHAILESVGDVVIYTDCDLAYGTDVVGEAAKRFDPPKTDLVIGSRNMSDDGYEGYTFIRKLASKIYIKVLCVVAGFKLSDSQCGFKAFRGEAARRIFSEVENDGFAFDIEVILTAISLGYTIGEMPVKIVNHRESKINVLSDSVRMLRDLIRIKKAVKERSRKR